MRKRFEPVDAAAIGQAFQQRMQQRAKTRSVIRRRPQAAYRSESWRSRWRHGLRGRGHCRDICFRIDGSGPGQIIAMNQSAARFDRQCLHTFQRVFEQTVRAFFLGLRTVALSALLAAAGNKHLPRARHGHVKQIQFFALRRLCLRIKEETPRRAARVLAAEKGKMPRRGFFWRPIDDDIPRLGRARCGVGIKQPDDRRLQPFGRMDRQNTHAIAHRLRGDDFPFVRRIAGVSFTQITQFIDKAGKAWIAPAIKVERQQQQRIQIGLDGGGTVFRTCPTIARKHFAFVINAVEQIVRRQITGNAQPGCQQTRRPQQARRRLPASGEFSEAPPP